MKIIHQGNKNYIKKLQYSQSLNCLLYICKHKEFEKNNDMDGHALKIYDLNKNDNPCNPLILQKFYGNVLFMKKINILEMEMIITSTIECLEISEEEKFDYFRDNLIINSVQENHKEDTKEVIANDENTHKQKAEKTIKNYKGKTINFFHLKSLVKNKYSPILSFSPEIQKITCAEVIKDLGNNYIAFSGEKKYIEIYKIISKEINNVMVFKEEKVLRLTMNFGIVGTEDCNNNIPFFCYLSTFDKFTFAVANELDSKQVENELSQNIFTGKFNFFEYNEKIEGLETKKLNIDKKQSNRTNQQKKLRSKPQEKIFRTGALIKIPKKLKK